MQANRSPHIVPYGGRLATTISLVVLGLVMSLLAPLPTRHLVFTLLGSELSLTFSGPAQLSAAILALVCAGVDGIVRALPQARGRSMAYTATFWVLPAVLTMVSLVLLGALGWWGYQVLVVASTGVALALVVSSQCRSVDLADPGHRSARTMLNCVVYLLALMWFTFLYGTRLRSAVSATGVALASGMLALELLRGEGRSWRTWVYAGTVGMMMGELTWALNYVGMDARIGGATLLLVFYTLTGIMQQHFWGRLTARVAVEYGLMCALCLAALGGLLSVFRR